MKRTRLLLLILIGTIWFCQQQNRSVNNLKAQWLRYIAEKDSLFKFADWSPLPPEDRKQFNGLKYFDYDPSWRFELPLYTYPNPQKMIIKGTRPGDERPSLRYGYFQFSKDGVPIKLDVIKILAQNPGEQDHLFLGFWDKTSGIETYAGGRYLDLEKRNGNLFVLDFNYAYNPYCAYSHRYSCAIPPFSNQIPIPVKAGEKTFKENH